MPSPAAQTQRETDDGVATAAKDSPGRVNSDSIPESDTEIDSNAEFQSRIRKEREISPTALSEEPDALSESTETHESDQQTSPPITEIDTLNAFEMHSRSGLQKALAIVSLAIGLMLYALDANMVSTALPTIVHDLGGQELLTWVGTANLLCSTAFAPLWGRLGDIFGRRRLLLVSTGCFTLSSLLSALSPTMLILILGRALQGLFSGAIQGLVFVLLSDVVSLRERGKYQAILGAITGGSSIVAPMIGGLITDSRWGWRGCFWLNVPLGVCAIGGYLLFLKTGPPEAKSLREMLGRVDWFGALLCVVGITLFLLGLTWAVKLGWGAAQVLGPLLSGLAVMALFVIWEWKGAKEPSVPITLFANRNYAICAGTMFFLGYGLNGAGYYIPLLYQLAFGNTPSQSGLKTIPWMGAHIPSSMTAGILSSRFGVYVFFPKVGMALASIAFGVMSTWDLGTGVGLQVGSLVMLGVGFGISLSMLLLAVQANLEKGTIGPGTTTAAFLRTIGGTVGIGVGGTIMQASVAAALSPDRLSALALSSNVSTTDLQLAVENTLNKLPSPSVPQPAIDAATHAVQEAYVSAITRVFLAAAPVVALGWILVVWLKHVPLRGKEAKEVSRVELDEQGKQGDPKV